MFSSGDSFEEDLKLGFGRQTHNFSNFFHNVSSIYGTRIKLHTKNQPPSMFSSGDSYEEDTKIMNLKTTLQFC